MRAALLVVMMASLFIVPFTTLLPIFARDILHVGASGQGLLLTGMGIGALGSAVIIATVGERLPRGMFMLGGAALYGLGVVAFASSPWFHLSMVLMIIIGLANVCCHALVQTVLQTYSPPEFRGRTMSMFQLSNVVMTVGSILIGALATLAGTQWAVVLMGGAGSLAILAIHLTLPQRVADSLMDSNRGSPMDDRGSKAVRATEMETAIEPDLPICDAHHHLWQRPPRDYLLNDLLEDLRSGHNIVATVAIECGYGYRRDGAPEFKPLGETEFLEGVANRVAADRAIKTRIGAAIVGHANLALGDAVAPVLEAHLAISPKRFRRDSPFGDLGWQRRLAQRSGAGIVGRRQIPRRFCLDGKAWTKLRRLGISSAIKRCRRFGAGVSRRFRLF